MFIYAAFSIYSYLLFEGDVFEPLHVLQQLKLGRNGFFLQFLKNFKEL